MNAVVTFLLLCGPVAFSQSVSCNLVAPGDLKSALSTSFGTGSPLPSGCSWKSTGEPKLTVTISTQSEKLYTGAKAGSKTPVSGLGDEAFLTGTDGFVSLWVKKGSVYLLLRLYGLPMKDAQPKVTALAKIAMPKV
jgi:hypothetical protein